MKFSGSLSEVDKERARYELIGVPYDGNAIKKGASEGPRAIRRASQRLETFLWQRNLELSDVWYFDRGDLRLEHNAFFDGEDLSELHTARKKVFIGGDHSISYPIVKDLVEHGEVAKVIAIDAHADFRDLYKNTKFSNACVMRRIAELVGCEQVIEIGVRSASAGEYAVIKDKIRIYDAELLRQKGIAGIAKELEEGDEKTYLSIDIDILDPSIAPGVEHPEPCGISLESLLSLIQEIIIRKNVVASDVVEVNPNLDTINGITSINASRIIFELLACYWKRDASH